MHNKKISRSQDAVLFFVISYIVGKFVAASRLFLGRLIKTLDDLKKVEMEENIYKTPKAEYDLHSAPDKIFFLINS
ncbi:MAG: hypothetical protein D3903_05975 [Candidatus Electrothrix sp. GM3_4]|nr:hypothetical protein [Candidatus Electrothrix sp. GM3_4]